MRRSSTARAYNDSATTGLGSRRLRTVQAATILIALANASAALAQPADKVARIGVLVVGAPPAENNCVMALRRGLSDLGYTEGRTHMLELRWAETRPEEAFPRFAAELVRLHVDLIVTITSQGLTETKRAAATVPVVMAVSSYPVERGLIVSLARPGGNITGLATYTGELYTKRLQLLAEAVAGVSRVAVLRIEGDVHDLIARDLEAAARQLGLKLQLIKVKAGTDLPAAFEAAARAGAQAVMTAQAPFFWVHRRQIAELAMKHRLPSLSGETGAADAGTLMSHGPSIPESCRRAAAFVDRILKGMKPSELPVEQPTKFELVLNLKTARALGLTFPPALVLRADRVIE